MRVPILLYFMLFSISFFAQEKDNKGVIKVKKTSNTDTTVYQSADVMPEFPGGIGAYSSYFQKNLVYPQTAKESSLQGTCILSFIVNTDGTIVNVKIFKTVPGCPECDLEAYRVVREMPRWRPGRNNGNKVKVQCYLPIKFTLPSKK
jgi:protein TonB